jgi:hypothetical protein
MLKTVKYTIKKAAKDQVEFVGAILTGVFAGSIFTLAYVKYDVKTSISFADIGGLLAGVGTIGLLLIAFKARKDWKKQSYHQQRIKSLDEMAFRYFEFYESVHLIINSLEDYRNFYHNHNLPNSRLIRVKNSEGVLSKDQENIICQTNNLITLKAKIKAATIRFEAIWGVNTISYPNINIIQFIEISESFKKFNAGPKHLYQTKKMRDSTKENQTKVDEEVINLYKQLKM